LRYFLDNAVGRIIFSIASSQADNAIITSKEGGIHNYSVKDGNKRIGEINGMDGKFHAA